MNNIERRRATCARKGHVWPEAWRSLTFHEVVDAWNEDPSVRVDEEVRYRACMVCYEIQYRQTLRTVRRTAADGTP